MVQQEVKRDERVREFASLDEVLGGGIVLLDNCVRHADSARSFLRDIYDINLFNRINPSKVRHEIEGIETLSNLISLENVLTIQDVADEFFAYVEILGYKIGNISKTYKLYRKNQKRNKDCGISAEEGNDSIKNLHENAFRTYRQLLSKVVPASLLGGKERYALVERMVMLLEDELKLKKDTSYHLGEHETDRAREKHADEKLVASAFCASMHSDGPIKILTQDTDFVSLVGVFSRLLCSESFLPYNALLRDSLRSNPVILYLKSSEGYEKLVDTSDSSRLFYPKNFEIYRKDRPRNNAIKAEIDRNWETWFAHTLTGQS